MTLRTVIPARKDAEGVGGICISENKIEEDALRGRVKCIQGGENDSREWDGLIVQATSSSRTKHLLPYNNTIQYNKNHSDPLSLKP